MSRRNTISCTVPTNCILNVLHKICTINTFRNHKQYSNELKHNKTLKIVSLEQSIKIIFSEMKIKFPYERKTQKYQLSSSPIDNRFDNNFTNAIC